MSMTSQSRIYAYLRASTEEQDANRARDALENFVAHHGRTISARFTENVSGASLRRPELFRLLEIAAPGDVLLVEQVDRLSRLNDADWQRLRQMIAAKGVRVVALDLPTSHMLVNTDNISDEFTGRMFSAINDMMLDMLAAIARKDYTDRRRRQGEGIKKAKEDGKYQGRPNDPKLHGAIIHCHEKGMSYTEIVNELGCGRGTISRVLKAHRENNSCK